MPCGRPGRPTPIRKRSADAFHQRCCRAMSRRRITFVKQWEPRPVASQRPVPFVSDARRCSDMAANTKTCAVRQHLCDVPQSAARLLCVAVASIRKAQDFGSAGSMPLALTTAETIRLAQSIQHRLNCARDSRLLDKDVVDMTHAREFAHRHKLKPRTQLALEIYDKDLFRAFMRKEQKLRHRRRSDLDATFLAIIFRSDPDVQTMMWDLPEIKEYLFRKGYPLGQSTSAQSVL